MAVATFPVTVYSVLASDLLDEFSISRAQLGVLGTCTGLAGALTAAYFGRVTDRIGSTRSIRTTLTLATITLLALAMAPTYALMLVAGLAAGVANGWSNPAGNTLIADNIPAGSRGFVAGIKQSGVQMGSFLGGLLLPFLAVAWDWRLAVAAFVVMPLAGLAMLAGRSGASHHQVGTHQAAGRLPSSIYWIAAYGTVSGLGTSAVFGFLPLFAEEDQLWSPEAAGLLIAVVGLVGFVSRLSWPTVSERRVGHGRTLRIQALSSTGAAALLALAASGVVASWVLVPAAVLLAVGSISWNAVGMLAVMDFSPPGRVGRGTGIVLLGFLLGLAAGPPLMGLSVDATGGYTRGWVAVAVLMITSAFLAVRIPDRSTLAAS